jgi:hypothetical protein
MHITINATKPPEPWGEGGGEGARQTGEKEREREEREREKREREKREREERERREREGGGGGGGVFSVFLGKKRISKSI